MKKIATQTMLVAAFAIGTAGLAAPALAQEAEMPVEMTDEELDAALAELLEAELDACEGDEACIDSVLDEYETDLDIGEDVAAPTDGMAVSSAAEGVAAAAPAQVEAAPAEAAETAMEAVTEATAPDAEGVLNSASEADEDSDGTGGSTRPRPRPD